MKSILATFNLVQGSLYDKAASGYHEKSHDVLLREENASNTLSGNLDGLLEQLENRCDKVDTWTLDRKVPANRKDQLKRQLKTNVKVPWHAYEEADLWCALKNYLRHLQSCPLGSANYLEWSRVQWDYWDFEKIQRIKSLLQRLSTPELKLVRSLFRIFYKVTNRPLSVTTLANDGTNRCCLMQSSELGSLEIAARLGPYLIWERGQAPRSSNNEKVNVQTIWLVSYMIEHYIEIFKQV